VNAQQVCRCKLVGHRTSVEMSTHANMVGHSYWCLTYEPTEGYLEMVDFRWGVAEIRNSKVLGIRNFRQVRAAESVILYVLCGGLSCLRYRLMCLDTPTLLYIS
jgi:hypothetical protein